MTTLRAHATSRDVRCDRCGWGFIVVAERFRPGEWYQEPALDAHLCPGCARRGTLSAGERAILRMRPGRPRPLGSAEPASVVLAIDDPSRRSRLAELVCNSEELRLVTACEADPACARRVADYQPHLLVLEARPRVNGSRDAILQGVRYRSPYTLIIAVGRGLGVVDRGPTRRIIPDRCLSPDASLTDLFQAAVEIASFLRGQPVP